jgi:hypothetical protein
MTPTFIVAIAVPRNRLIKRQAFVAVPQRIVENVSPGGASVSFMKQA